VSIVTSMCCSSAASASKGGVPGIRREFPRFADVVASVAQTTVRAAARRSGRREILPLRDSHSVDSVVCDHRMRVRKAGADVRELQFGVIIEEALDGFALRKQALDQLTEMRMPRMIGLPPKRSQGRP
jgi:hypothetical protein